MRTSFQSFEETLFKIESWVGKDLTSKCALIREMKLILKEWEDKYSDYDSYLFKHIKKKILMSNCTNSMAAWIKGVTKTLDKTSKKFK